AGSVGARPRRRPFVSQSGAGLPAPRRSRRRFRTWPPRAGSARRCAPAQARGRDAPGTASSLLNDLALLNQPGAVAFDDGVLVAAHSADRKRSARRTGDRLPVRAMTSFVIVHELDVGVRERVI